MFLSQIHMILSFCEILPLASLLFVVSRGLKKHWHSVVSIYCSAAIVIINTIQFYLEIALGWSHGLTSAVIILGGLNLIISIVTIICEKKSKYTTN